jgi:hypothetical protein
MPPPIGCLRRPLIHGAVASMLPNLVTPIWLIVSVVGVSQGRVWLIWPCAKTIGAAHPTLHGAKRTAVALVSTFIVDDPRRPLPKTASGPPVWSAFRAARTWTAFISKTVLPLGAGTYWNHGVGLVGPAGCQMPRRTTGLLTETVPSVA